MIQFISEKMAIYVLIKVLIAFSIVAFTLVSSQQSNASGRFANKQVNCSNIVEVLDKCGALSSYSHTVPGAAYPTTLEELRLACPRQNEGLHCLRQHVKCLKPLTKRAILSFIESRRKHVRKLCSDIKGQAARDFVSAFKCIREHKHQKFIDSEIKAIAKMEAIISDQVKDFKERFQRSCCSIADYKTRTLNDMKQECTTPDRIAAVEAAIDSVVGEALEFACPDPKSNICAKLPDLKLSDKPSGKSLTRAGTDLMIILTAPEGKET